MLLSAAVTLPSGPMVAQATPAACTYQTCALAIAPTWNGLSVVRGENRARVANLHFFLPRNIDSAFGGPPVAGADSTQAWAATAVQRRRVAAAFTDAGGALMIVAAVVGTRDTGARRSMTVAGLGGAALFGISVPIQFAADDALARAVWWFNRRFTP